MYKKSGSKKSLATKISGKLSLLKSPIEALNPQALLSIPASLVMFVNVDPSFLNN